MKAKHTNVGAAIAALVLLLLPCAYVASYFALVTSDELGFKTGYGPWSRPASYFIGGRGAIAFFAPMNQLDRQLRPEYWEDPVPYSDKIK